MNDTLNERQHRSCAHYDCESQLIELAAEVSQALKKE